MACVIWTQLSVRRPVDDVESGWLVVIVPYEVAPGQGWLKTPLGPPTYRVHHDAPDASCVNPKAAVSATRKAATTLSRAPRERPSLGCT
jgi:hypothetical protein